jgi:transposase
MPLPTGGDRRSVLKPHRDWLLELRRKENDLTLDAIAERLALQLSSCFEVRTLSDRLVSSAP